MQYNTLDDFIAKVEQLDALILAYKRLPKPTSYHTVESYWERHTSPSLKEIHSLFCQILERDIGHWWAVSVGPMGFENDGSIWGGEPEDMLCWYPNEPDALTRLARFIESRFLKGKNIEELSKQHESPLKRNDYTALAALHRRIESALIYLEENKRVETNPINEAKPSRYRWADNYPEMDAMLAAGKKPSEVVRAMAKKLRLNEDETELLRSAWRNHLYYVAKKSKKSN